MLPLRTSVHADPLDGIRTLIVEDQLLPGSELCRALQQRGHDVVWVESGQEAERWLEEREVDMVLLDLSLPDVDSLALCRRLCARGSCQVIVIADEDDHDKHVAALVSGAADVVTRSTPLRLLLRRMANVWVRACQDAAWRGQVEHLSAYLPAAATVPRPNAPERVSATLLFSDLRGFTRASFSQDAAEVFNFINQILALQISAVQHFGGYVDGFSGDGMLALFDDTSGAQQACQAALQILTLAGRTAIGPWDHLPVAMGIHCGEVMRGDLGVQRRKVFTILGSPVNLAARLCGVASAREAVVSQAIIDSLPANSGLTFSNSRTVNLKGIPEPFAVQTLS